MKSLWQRVRGEVVGGATAAVVALPLGIAFGIASGAGALAGLYASIFGGFIAALFGGCGVQITGPTGAMTAVLVGIVREHGVGGMFLAGAMAGLLQIILGLLRLGKFVKYLPQPVIAGFTNGVAVLFFMTAIDDALQTPVITIITATVILISLRYFKGVPESLFGLIAGLIFNELLFHSPHVVGDLSFQMPQLTLAQLPWANLGQLVMPAVTICLLGSVSSLLSAEVTDQMLGCQHNSNRELIGQGLGNIVSALVGGVPVAGAVARSGVNVHSGGRTRLSSMLHAIFLLLMVVVFGPVARRIPLASLAAILMIASIRTADWKSMRLVPRVRWSYGLIMFITTLLTVTHGLILGVGAGVLLTACVVLVDLSVLPRVRGGAIEAAVAGSPRPEIQVLTIDGPLFFTGVESWRTQLNELAQGPILVLDFSLVPVMDETGALAIKESVRQLKSRGKSVYIAGLNRRALRMLIRSGLVEAIGRSRIRKDRGDALRKAIEEAPN